MKIDILPRSFFEERLGSAEITNLLRGKKIVSIQSSNGWDSEPPFTDENKASENLLCITLDDYFSLSEDKDEIVSVAKFDSRLADRIMRFIDDGRCDATIHCTAGVSRSGAIGMVLNEYFNKIVRDDKDDYEYFYSKNPQIMPNPNILLKFAGFLEIDFRRK